MVAFSKPGYIAAAAVVVKAFTIPPGTPDGVYSVMTNDAGDDIHVLIAHPADYTSLEQRDNLSKSLEVRADPPVTCSGNKHFNHGDTDAANPDLDRQCNTGMDVEGRHNYYAIRGSVVAFFCNFDTGGKICSASSRKAHSKAITADCGLYSGGWTDVDKWSYGYDLSSSKFCDTGK